MDSYKSIYLFALLTFLIFTSCQETPQPPTDPEHSVEIIAKDFTFDGPTEIQSGWHTFKFVNSGHAEHFFLLNLLPDSIDFKRYHEEVTQPFDRVYDSLKAGISKEEAGAMLGEKIPGWYFAGVKPMGGPGIVDAGMNAWVSMKLEPGTYVLECYIKEEGVFHTTLGMIRPMEVTEDSTIMKEPEANYTMRLSNFEYNTEGDLKNGWNTVAVHFEEHPQYELGNDVHLIEMADTTNLDSVIQWMNWMNLEGLESPAPAKFLGGAQEMPVGHTAYFRVKLEPGNYAWLAESAAAKGMVKEFSIE